MKNLLILVIILLSLFESKLLLANPPKVFDADSTQVDIFTSEKFRSSVGNLEFLEIVVVLTLSNTCQKVESSSAELGSQNSIVNLRLKIAEYDGCTALTNQPVKATVVTRVLEKLSPGEYFIHVNGKPLKTENKLSIKEYTDFVAVDFVRLEKDRVMVGGVFDSSNKRFDHFEINLVDSKSLQVTPIVEEVSDDASSFGSYPWRSELKLPQVLIDELKSGKKVLIRVLSKHLNFRGATVSSSLNRVISPTEFKSAE